MPSVVKNQSQLRVPPIPWMTAPPLSANGNCRPELSTAVLLPAAGLPITMYQGSSYSAALPDICPSLERLMVLTASARRTRRASTSSRLSGVAVLSAVACSSTPSSLLLA